MILGRVVLGALCEGCSAVWRSTKLLDGVWRTATESGCGAKIGANSGVGSEELSIMFLSDFIGELVGL